MKKRISKSKELRKKLLEGVLKLSDVVGSTMGPKGRNVLIQRKLGYPTITNDGVTIAREFELEDPYEDMGAKIVIQAASRTNDSAGDGTSTATVLASEMIEIGIELLDSRRSAGRTYNPVKLKNGMQKAMEEIKKDLDKQVKEIKSKDDLKKVATISCQNEEAGEIISQAFDKVGQDGAVHVESGSKIGYDLEIMEGMKVPAEIYTPLLSTDPKGGATLENCHILITSSRISSFMDIHPLLNALLDKGVKKLVVFCDSVMGDTLQNMVVNKVKGYFTCIPVKVELTGERKGHLLEDVAIATGGTMITPESGLTLKTIKEEHLGFAKTISINKNTVIVGGRADRERMKNRIDNLKAEVSVTNLEYERELLVERISRLSDGVAVIRVGAVAELELKEAQYRVEDALNATRAAIEEGVIVGGGNALMMAAEKVDPNKYEEEEREGARIVKLAVKRPFEQILRNAGEDPKNFKVSPKKGYNVSTGKEEDLMIAGVIDPKKVTRLALENAVSAAGMFLTTESAISIIPKDATIN